MSKIIWKRVHDWIHENDECHMVLLINQNKHYKIRLKIRNKETHKIKTIHNSDWYQPGNLNLFILDRIASCLAKEYMYNEELYGTFFDLNAIIGSSYYRIDTESPMFFRSQLKEYHDCTKLDCNNCRNMPFRCNDEIWMICEFCDNELRLDIRVYRCLPPRMECSFGVETTYDQLNSLLSLAETATLREIYTIAHEKIVTFYHDKFAKQMSESVTFLPMPLIRLILEYVV